MLACERWTLTQSSGWFAALAWLALALLLGLLSGLAAMSASRVAETVAAAELCDDDADAEPAWDGEPVGDVDAEPVPDGEPVADADDGDAEPGVGLGLDGEGDAVLLDVLPDAGAVGEAEADVDEPEGDGDGDVVGLEVDGDGVGVLAVGSTSHLVSVLALAVLLVLAVLFTLAVVRALAEVLALSEAALALTVPARAAPGQPASTPRVRNPPASRLSTAACTCARRINIALSTLLIEATVCSLWGSEATG